MNDKLIKYFDEVDSIIDTPNLDAGRKWSIIKLLRKVRQDTFNEIYQLLEEKKKSLYGNSSHGSCCTCKCKHFYEDDECACKEISLLTKMINKIKRHNK